MNYVDVSISVIGHVCTISSDCVLRYILGVHMGFMNTIMSHYDDICYGCFSSDNLVSCGRCVYKICKRCIINEKFSYTKISLCRHPECVYDHLDKNEAETYNAFVCDKIPPALAYTCGACGMNTNISVEEVTPAILLAVINSPCRIWEKEIREINHRMMFFSIRNMDDDTYELIKVWKT